jgi:hypothetical protein
MMLKPSLFNSAVTMLTVSLNVFLTFLLIEYSITNVFINVKGARRPIHGIA